MIAPSRSRKAGLSPRRQRTGRTPPRGVGDGGSSCKRARASRRSRRVRRRPRGRGAGAGGAALRCLSGVACGARLELEDLGPAALGKRPVDARMESGREGLQAPHLQRCTTFLPLAERDLGLKRSTCASSLELPARVGGKLDRISINIAVS